MVVGFFNRVNFELFTPQVIYIHYVIWGVDVENNRVFCYNTQDVINFYKERNESSRKNLWQTIYCQ